MSTRQLVQPIRNLEKINEMKGILKKQSNKNYFLFVFGINLGLRINDILKLKVSDVKGNTHISINENKTGKVKLLKINNALHTEINEYTANMKDNDYLFPSRNGRNIKPISRVRAYILLNNAGKQVGLNKIGTHSLRKTFWYHFYKRTNNVALLQEIFNHSSSEETLRYIGINQELMDNAIDQFSL